MELVACGQLHPAGLRGNMAAGAIGVADFDLGQRAGRATRDAACRHVFARGDHQAG